MTGPNPIAEALERDWQRIRHPSRHAVPLAQGGDARNVIQTPANMPATMVTATAAAATKESTMSIATLEDAVKTDLTDGIDWLDGFVGRIKAAAPGIIATSEAVGGSTVGALVEAVAGRILPPQLESVLAGLVKDFVDRNAAPAATVADSTAAQPAPAPAQ